MSTDNSILLEGNCLERLKDLDDNSIDSIVTDPPYGLSFMSKKWDYDVPGVEIWVECLRVLKPGGHLLSFGGTRTYHRLVLAIEDAGFEIRDQIQWIYGSGFPKSHNIKEGEFKGWGTALKPANEPICVARKPLEGTVAHNIEKWGVGGLNIDESRIEGLSEKEFNWTPQRQTPKAEGIYGGGKGFIPKEEQSMFNPKGRWPANIIFDEVAAEMLPNENKQSVSRFFYVAKASKRERNEGLEGMPKKSQGAYGEFAGDGRGRQTEHQPTANHHPTVKPIKLMEYLIKLVTPKGGIILDPFMGSGSTGVAAVALGYTFVGIEMDPEYMQIAEKRVKGA
jgi:DNA modification methylase